MRCSMIGLLGGIILVGLAVAQAPTPQPTTPQPPSPTPGGGFRGRGGFQPTAPDASGRGGTTVRPEAATRAAPSPLDGPLLRSFPPLPESSAVGKLVLLEILIADVTGSFENPTAAKILEMENEGRLSGTSRIRLTALENQPAFAQFGERAPRVIGRTTTGLATMPIYNDVNVGTIVQATTRMESDGAALVQLYLSKSALGKAAADAGANPLELQPISTVTAQSTVRVAPGEPVLISTGPSATPAANQTWIVLSFRVL